MVELEIYVETQAVMWWRFGASTSFMVHQPEICPRRTSVCRKNDSLILLSPRARATASGANSWNNVLLYFGHLDCPIQDKSAITSSVKRWICIESMIIVIAKETLGKLTGTQLPTRVG